MTAPSPPPSSPLSSRLRGLFQRLGRPGARSSKVPDAGGGKGRLQRSAVGCAWVLLFVFSFLTFFYLTFPYDRVRDFVVHRIEAQMPGSEVEIISLEPAWLTGIEARGVRVRLPAEPSEPGSTEASEPQRRALRPSVTIPYLYARLGIFAWLTGSYLVSFEAETDGGGRVDGFVRQGSSSTAVRAHLDAIDLRRLSIVHHYAGTSFAGELSGDVDLVIAEDENDSDGTLELTIAGASIGDEHFEVPLPIPGMSNLRVTRVTLGDVALSATLEDGTARLTHFSESGEDLLLRVNGTSRVRRALRATTFDLLVRAALERPYLDRNPTLVGALELAGSSPMVAPYRTSDGAFQVRVQGTAAGHVTVIAAGSVAMPD